MGARRQPAAPARSLRAMATVIPIEDLRLSPRAARFEGGEETPISTFVTRYARGEGPNLHLHPYPETFVVQTGSARFTAGDEQLTVAAGHIVIVPADTPHGFKNPAEETLNVLSVHASPRVIQTDLA
jgi:mannose-6-phosphate isomerase-like protein (cupin superfamily)